MLELHLTNEGWVPVDIPSPPVCYESSTEPLDIRPPVSTQTQRMIKTTHSFTTPEPWRCHTLAHVPARPRSGPEGSQGKGQSVQGKGRPLRKA